MFYRDRGISMVYNKLLLASSVGICSKIISDNIWENRLLNMFVVAADKDGNASSYVVWGRRAVVVDDDGDKMFSRMGINSLTLTFLRMFWDGEGVGGEAAIVAA